MWIFNLIFILASIKIQFRIVQLIQAVFLFKECPDYQAKYGKNSWAIVTGATDGIGWGFCIELAKRGFNIVLVSRTESKLIERKEELLKLWPKIKARVVVFDSSEKYTQKDYEDMFKSLEDLDISGVVNNVGQAQSFLCKPYVKDDPNVTKEQYKEGDRDTINLLKINILTQTHFYHHFIPKLKARKQRSFMIDMSSVASFLDAGLFPLYGATKAYNQFLSLAESETNNLNVDFLCVKPWTVQTNLYQKNSGTFDYIMRLQKQISTVEECVVGSLKNLGNHNECYGSTRHEIICMIFELGNSLLPVSKIFRFVIGFKFFKKNFQVGF